MEPQAINEIVPEHKAGYWKLRHIRLINNLINVLFYVCLGWLLRERMDIWLAPVFFLGNLIRGFFEFWMSSLRRSMGLVSTKSPSQPNATPSVRRLTGRVAELAGMVAQSLILWWIIIMINDPARHGRGTIFLLIVAIPMLLMTLLGLMAPKQLRIAVLTKLFLPLNAILWVLRIVRRSELVWLFWAEAAFLLILAIVRYISYKPSVESFAQNIKTWSRTFRSSGDK